MFSERPFADGRPTAVFVFNALRADAGRLTQLWLARLRAFDAAGWATHAVLINKDPQLARTVAGLTADGHFPARTHLHHYALRSRNVRPEWWGPLPAGTTIDPRVGDWLDWLTGQIPGAVVFADSPAAYPYLSHMSNPLVARVAAVHLNHLAGSAADGLGALSARFAARFDGHVDAFDAVVVLTHAQAGDLRDRYGPDLPVHVIPPGVDVVPLAAGKSASPPPRTIVVSVGPLEGASGHERVIGAMPGVLAHQPDATLRIVAAGDPAAAQGLLSVADSIGVRSSVRIVDPADDLDAQLADAGVLVWAGMRESWPLVLVRSLARGVPVVAHDVRYGPAEIVTSPALGELVAAQADLADPISRQLARWAGAEPVDEMVREAAGPLLRRTDPMEVGARWASLALELADRACDHRAPSLLVETLSTSTRILRMPGILADAATDLSTWACELPGIDEPVGWLTRPPATRAADADEEEPSPHPHAAGPTRDVIAYLRSNALAFHAVEADAPVRVDFTDGSSVAPLLTTAFAERIIASRVGNATLRRQHDGSILVSPRRELIEAQNVDGRLLVRTAPDAPASDVTHAVNWTVDLDWADLRATSEGAAFTGTLRARWLAPAEGSAPALCVPDVGGYSRVVGQLEYTSAPRVDDLEWTADVRGVLATDPLVATTELARRALPLHVGMPGLLVPIGGLWSYGHRERIQLQCPRGTVTLLPSPGGRVLVAPGHGVRARVSGAVRSLVTRG